MSQPEHPCSSSRHFLFFWTSSGLADSSFSLVNFCFVFFPSILSPKATSLAPYLAEARTTQNWRHTTFSLLASWNHLCSLLLLSRYVACSRLPASNEPTPKCFSAFHSKPWLKERRTLFATLQQSPRAGNFAEWMGTCRYLL